MFDFQTRLFDYFAKFYSTEQQKETNSQNDPRKLCVERKLNRRRETEFKCGKCTNELNKTDERLAERLKTNRILFEHLA